MRLRLKAALALVALSLPAAAQNNQWDWVISNFSGGLYGSAILNFDGPSRTLVLNQALPVSADASNPIMDPDNNFCYITSRADTILQVHNQGTVITLASGLGYTITCLDADEDGTFVCGGASGILNRVTRTGVITTIATALGTMNAVEWDVDTGNIIVGTFLSTPALWRVTRSGVKTTLVASLGGIGVSGIDQHHPSGDFIVSGFTGGGINGAILRVTGGGAVSTVATGGPELATPNGVEVLHTGHPDGEYNIAVAEFGGAPTGLYVFDLNGRLVSTILNFPAGNTNGIGPSGVCVNQGKALSGAGNARLGTLYQLKLRNEGPVPYGNKIYVISGSFGARPGFTLADGRQVNLALDPLYFVTTQNLLPGIFQNFVGSLNSAGDANANVLILNEPVIIGLRTFYSYAVIDGAFPSSIQQVSNTHAFTIQP